MMQDSRRDAKAPLRVHVLYETADYEHPHGCGYIRLLLPLTHPSLAGRIWMSSGVELPEEPVDLVIIERLWFGNFDVFFLEQKLAELERRGIPYIHTFDDQLLRVDRPPYDNKALTYRLMRSAAGLIVSTEALAGEVRRFNDQVHVVGNSLDERLFQEREAAPLPEDAGKVVFGYMGTFTHLEDLLMILAPLRRVLSRHKDKAVLEIVGVADGPLLRELFPGLPVRVRSAPVECVPYPEFVKWMQRELRWDFAIAPLRDNEFTRFKSDLKILDYGVLGIPGIFSDVSVYNRTLRHGETGLLAANEPEAWEAALERMLSDTAGRQSMAKGVREYVWQHRMLEQNVHLWADAIEAVYRRHKGLDAPVPVEEEDETGAQEAPARPASEEQDLPLSRKDRLLQGVDASGLGLEIGPGLHPLLPKREGYRVETIDHASAEELRAKYASLEDKERLELIEEVDFVWKGGPMDELTGRKGYYDFIVASHVLEHVPDLVAFFQQCETMLKDNGRLCLALPDKRFCFDTLRGRASTGDVLQAHLEKRTRHTPGKVFDHFAYYMKYDGQDGWDKNARGNFALQYDLSVAVLHYERSQREDAYIDVHNWAFTPAAFRMIMNNLRIMGLTTLVEAFFAPTEGIEFMVGYAKNPQDAPDPEFMRNQLAEELREEQRWRV